MAIGRPREFDPQRVLDTAMRLFWRHGYDGVSISDLTEATGINRRSLYAQFGCKEKLFRDAVEHYVAGYGNYAAVALAEPTARDVASAMVHGAADATSMADLPPGCLLVQSALAVSAEAAPLYAGLAEMREAGVLALAQRFAEAQAAGELAGEDPGALARWIASVCQGIAVQAAGGATRDDLHAIADRALRAWP
ncbi:TetR/AcrR family transcriptional regulator [Mycolicibacterium fluoranthenivorans]|jgi:AcrR family transcriptional regulator|uniref:TetR/AcrR family transcriptional regulator n=1 Tax=Mycolicibacterium fluoranthenivorans TaxID=258505 RepID=A0A7G8PN01_9MYCO|nr:TetR/AcrR family transcriptional regulator [Mycolicibacterium fluoranthenivorans]QNJ95717.1 TetR/AcrR family transcriptional regulator [Mycolicibacterium fluoranthenivorans]